MFWSLFTDSFFAYYKGTIVVLIVVLWAMPLQAQPNAVPAILNFGDIGYSLLGGVDYVRSFALLNNSDSETLTIHRMTYVPKVGRGSRNGGNVLAEAITEVLLKPQEQRRYGYQIRCWDSISYTDSVLVIWSYASSKQRDTLFVPVVANPVRKPAPYITHLDITEHKWCDCALSNLSAQDELWQGYFRIVNPTNDTITLDSITTPLITQGIRISDTVYTFDEVGIVDSLGKYPPGHWSMLPRTILPGMILSIQVVSEGGKPGDRSAILRAYLHGNSGERFQLQDTVRHGIQLYNSPVFVGTTDNDVNIRYTDVDSTSLRISISLCTIPESANVTLEAVTFSGLRKDDLLLLPQQSGLPLPLLPASISCDDVMRYRLLFHPSTPGNSIDTVWAVYRFTDSIGNVTLDSTYLLIYLTATAPLSVPVVERPISLHKPGVQLNIYPNPVSRSLRIVLPWVNLGTQGGITTVSLFDSQGGIVLNQEVNVDVTSEASLDVSALPESNYLVVVCNNGQTIGSARIVILR
jgi:hypothetical protein